MAACMTLLALQTLNGMLQFKWLLMLVSVEHLRMIIFDIVFNMICTSLQLGINYLHQMGIIHRDLKVPPCFTHNSLQYLQLINFFVPILGLLKSSNLLVSMNHCGNYDPFQYLTIFLFIYLRWTQIGLSKLLILVSGMMSQSYTQRERNNMFLFMLVLTYCPFSQKMESREWNILTGTAGYIAPEVINGDPPTFKSDVYAMGIILWVRTRPSSHGIMCLV